MINQCKYSLLQCRLDCPSYNISEQRIINQYEHSLLQYYLDYPSYNISKQKLINQQAEDSLLQYRPRLSQLQYSNYQDISLLQYCLDYSQLQYSNYQDISLLQCRLDRPSYSINKRRLVVVITRIIVSYSINQTIPAIVEANRGQQQQLLG